MASATTTELPVTVVIPAHNRATLLPRAIDSIRRQDRYRPQEVVVVDDASSDDTAAVAERCGARVLRHPDNRGPGAARNTGFAAARTPWIAQLDSDDEWMPCCLSTLWGLREGRVLVSGAYLGERPQPFFMGWPGARPRELRSPVQLFFPDNLICTSAVLMRAEMVREVGGYDCTLRYAEDLDLWVRMLEVGTGVVSPTIIDRNHRHAGQATAVAGKLDEGHRQVISRYRDRPWWSGALSRRCEVKPVWEECRRARRQGDLGTAFRLLRSLLSDRHGAQALAELLAHNHRCRRALRDGRDLLTLQPPTA